MTQPAMASPANQPATDPPVCPYLGLSGDRPTHFAFPTTDHRCYSGTAMNVISVAHQGALCLTEKYPDCRRFVEPVPAAVPSTKLSEAASGLERPTGPSVRSGRTTAGRGPIIRAGAILIVVIVASAVWIQSRGGIAGVGPTASQTASPASSAYGPLPSPEPAVTLSDAPTTNPTPTPIPGPTSHVVKAGETLSSIARRAGVTVQAIQDANGITDPNYIVVGSVLIIPAP